MTFDWQNAIVLLMVAGAIGFLAWRSWLALRQRAKTGCGACGSCAANQTAEGGKPLVSLDAMLKPRR